jgi:protein involved in polysaccharide export with SLBB domain
MNYVLGTVGANGFQFGNLCMVPVTTEGEVTIQYVGQISVSGLTIEAAIRSKVPLRVFIVQLHRSVLVGGSWQII